MRGDTVHGQSELLGGTGSTTEDDRGVVHVETRGHDQDGVLVRVFRRTVMVPERVHAERTGGEFPGRPEPREQWAAPSPGRRSSTAVHLGTTAA